MNKEQIDILMATYNGEKYLKEQIESILNQSYSNFRLIISDDCSKDNTKSILQDYSKKDNRIIVYYQEKNLGYVKNFEFLLSKVENNLYALSDQDDIWMPEKIEKAVEKIKQDNADLYFSDLIIVDENSNKISESFWKQKGFYKKVLKDKKHRGLLLNNYITGCTIVSKKEFLKDILPLPQNTKYMIHDYWIAIVLSKKGKIVYDNNSYIKYRQHDYNQVGIKTKSKELKSLNEIRNMFLDVKIEHYEIFNLNKKLFNEKEQKLNEKALKYFKSLKNTKIINFKNWLLFYKLYKYENNKYFLANFIILNIPIIARNIYRKG